MSNKPFNPVYKSPEYSETLPLSGKQVAFRPYNVGDERILAAAAASRNDDIEFYVTNTINVIQGVVTNDVNIKKLPAIDVRWLLLQQRAKSVGKKIEFKYKDKPMEISIDDLFIDGKKTKDQYKVDVGNGMGVVMRDLTFEQEISATSSSTGELDNKQKVNIFYKMLLGSIESVYDGDDLWVVGTDISAEELENFINSIPSEQSRPLYNFVTDMPRIAVKIVVDEEEIVLTDRDVDFLS